MLKAGTIHFVHLLNFLSFLEYQFSSPEGNAPVTKPMSCQGSRGLHGKGHHMGECPISSLDFSRD
jgi:hypothetical protein